MWIQKSKLTFTRTPGVRLDGHGIIQEKYIWKSVLLPHHHLSCWYDIILPHNRKKSWLWRKSDNDSSAAAWMTWRDTLQKNDIEMSKHITSKGNRMVRMRFDDDGTRRKNVDDMTMKWWWDEVFWYIPKLCLCNANGRKRHTHANTKQTHTLNVQQHNKGQDLIALLCVEWSEKWMYDR